MNKKTSTAKKQIQSLHNSIKFNENINMENSNDINKTNKNVTNLSNSLNNNNTLINYFTGIFYCFKLFDLENPPHFIMDYDISNNIPLNQGFELFN